MVSKLLMVLSARYPARPLRFACLYNSVFDALHFYWDISILWLSYVQVSYVLDTEDFLFRLRKRRRLSAGGLVPDKLQTSKKDAAKVQRFHLFLAKP
jgi:hypothetical protein